MPDEVGVRTTDRLLTPSKLTAWLDCEHALTLQHRVDDGAMPRPDQGMGAFAELLMEKGLEHEEACLLAYRAEGRSVFTVEDRRTGQSFADWVTEVGDVLAAGHEVIYQMPFIHDGLRGIADFLERVDLPDGTFTYEPVDAKLARADAKPGHVLQLCFYADAIAASVGTAPERMHLWLGSGHRETIRTSEVRPYWTRLRTRLRRLMAAGTAEATTRPAPNRHCQFCAFAGHCEDEWRAADALHYVAGIRSTHIEALEVAGLSTLASLAERTDPVDAIDDARLERLRDQAALQVQARADAEEIPPFRHIAPGDDPPWGQGHGLLPEPDDGDVFLDFEGHPFWRADAGLFFLFGFISRDHRGQWAFTGRWAHTLEQETEAAAWLVDALLQRREQHPDMHVYHYNHTERSSLEALFERSGLDDRHLAALIREGAFVDLLEVVRNAVQVGTESYGLKNLERLAGYQRGHDIDKGAGAVLEYESFMKRVAPDERPGLTHDEAPELRAIAAYNEDDVRATMALRDWLVDIRPDGVPWRPAQLEEAPVNAEVDELVERLRALGEPADLLLADMLGYWGREGRANTAQLRARAEAPAERLRIDEDAIVGLHGHQVEAQFTRTGRQSVNSGLVAAFPPQPVGDISKVMYLTADGAPAWADVIAIDAEGGTATLRYGTDAADRRDAPTVIVRNDWVSPSTKRQAVESWARLAADAGGVAGLDDAASNLLRREPPRFRPGTGPPSEGFSDDLDTMIEWIDGLDHSWLAVQGPPGTGKTYRAAHAIHQLVLRGRRVGVTAMSHAAIHNLVAATHKVFAEAGNLDRLAAVVRCREVPDDPLAGVTYSQTNPPCLDPSLNLIAGTAWLFARQDMQDSPLDVLFVDEAGQLALIDVVAAAGATTNIVLLGDPQQLPQVTQGSHPNGSGASVLEHVLDGAKTLSPEVGVFLPQTWRLHPDICAFTSEQFYEGRLVSHPSCAQQATDLGTGLRWLRAEHTDCSTRSEEEVELIIDEIRRVLGGTWTDPDGQTRQLTIDDIMVVTPYNNQKDALRRGIEADPVLRAVRVGTVDKFQGQEAPVVFFSAASSTAEDASRGLEFVFSPNRFNVAISRARCLAFLVCTEALLDATARTVAEMKVISNACALVEHAEKLESVSGNLHAID